MIRVFSHDNIVLVHNIKNLLQHQGIECQTRNDIIASAAGEVPPTVVWPEVWIVHERDLDRATQIVEDAIHGPSHATSWRCPKCGERNDPAFELCWNCTHDPEDSS